MKNGTDYTSLNLKKLNPDTPIYRIFSKDRLFQMFQNKENVLVWPTKWEDPFENFILRAPVETEDGERGTFSFHKDFYGQCWTLHKASDAMWRIYSPNKDAVRVRTTIDKLAKSVSANLGQWAHVQAFIGKVEYLSDKGLQNFAETIFRSGLDSSAPARSLLVKRAAFSHEREVRVLYFEKDRVAHPDGLYRYQIDPHDLIDQIMIDPRLSLEEVEKLKGEIKSRTGYKGKIKRSLLYAPPKGFVVRIP